MGLESFQIVAAIIFSIGLYGALSKRNAITVLMSIELMFNAVNISAVAFSRYVVPFSIGPEAQGDLASVGDEGGGPQSANFDEVWKRLRQERKNFSGQETRSPAEETTDVEEDGVIKGDATESGRPGSMAGLAAGGGAASGPRSGNFDNVWQRLQHEREERSNASIEEVADVRGLGTLPQSYRMTIEDKDGTPVDLVTVHRALLSFAPADDVSLNNFANGTAVISLRTTGELDLDELASVIGAATSRECEVIPQGQGKLFLRLSVEEDTEQDSDG